MASAKPQFIATPSLLAQLIMATFDFIGAQTGVCYGRLGNGLPSPPDAISLCNRNNIRRMQIYDPHQPTLEALRGSNIEVILIEIG